MAKQTYTWVNVPREVEIKRGEEALEDYINIITKRESERALQLEKQKKIRKEKVVKLLQQINKKEKY